MSTKSTFGLPVIFIAIGLVFVFFGTSRNEETMLTLGWILIVFGVIQQFLPIFRRRRL